MKKKQKLKERICALVLALAMVLTWVLPDAGMTVQAAAGDAKKVTLKFKDAAEETRGIGALTLKLQSNDDPSYEKKKEIEVKAGETTVVVTERNFDESAVRFNITNTDGTQPAISGWTHSANAGVSDDATHTCQVTFAADGDYTFTLLIFHWTGR